MVRVVSALCGVFCLLAVTAGAQAPDHEAASPSQAQGVAVRASGGVRGGADPASVVERDDRGAITTVRATRVREPIVLDGQLKEDVYGRVPFIDGFVQQEPAQGQPGTEKTQVWLLFDERNIYIAGRLFDSAPEREIVTEMRRDGQGTNDNESFGVAFDTFHDRRNGFLFQVSLAGGLFDGYITDERDMSRDWSTVWNARTARTPEGWTVEMAIPFKSLRYPPGAEQTWGINLKRVVRWKNETQHLTEIPAVLGRRGMNRLSAGATLVGLEAPNIHRVFEVKPYGISGFTTEAPAGSLSNTSGKGDGGFDVKLGITKGLTADVTYNTDFAQVELDEQQVNLTRFSIQFPEKREFFLEGGGIFAFGGVAPSPRGGTNSYGNPQANDIPVMFFSRAIGLDNGRPTPIDVGGRVTGKAGRYSVGVIDIRSAGVESRNVDATNFGIVRIKRDILQRSAIGMIYTDRSNSTFGAGAGRTAGVDGIFSFGPNLSFNSYFALTDNPGLTGRNTSHRVQMDYNADKYGVQIERVALDENFRPDVGFTRRTAFTRNSAYVRYSPRPNRKLLRKWYVDAGYDYVTDPAGRLQSRQAQTAFRSEFQNGDSWALELGSLYEYLPAPFRIASNVTLPVGGYGFQEVRLNYNFGPQRPVSAQVQFEMGEFYGGRRTTLSASRGRVQISPQLMLEPGVTLNAVSTPYGDFTSTLLSTRTNFTMTPRQGVSALLQYNSANNSFSTNIRYRWEYIPGSDLFVVLTDNRDTLPSGFPQLRDRALIVKFTKLFRF